MIVFLFLYLNCDKHDVKTEVDASATHFQEIIPTVLQPQFCIHLGIISDLRLRRSCFFLISSAILPRIIFRSVGVFGPVPSAQPVPFHRTHTHVHHQQAAAAVTGGSYETDPFW
jgi:hypothetical protein